MPSKADLERARRGTAIGPITHAINNHTGPIISEDAARRVHELELVDITGDRSSGEGRLRGSLLGGCDRQQILSFHGYVGAEPTGAGLAMMNDGTQRHYWWQKVGLTVGFLDDIETKVWHEPYRFGGQLDGVGTDIHGRRYGFELKTTNPTKYSQGFADPGLSYEEWTTVGESGLALTKHLEQVGGYLEALPELEYFVLVYEKRDFTVEWREVVVPREVAVAASQARFPQLLAHIENRTLPPVLPDYPTNKQCKYWCDFTSICPFAEL